MKVCQILPNLNFGGVEQGTIEVAKFLKNQNIDNIVISNGGRMAKELENAGILHIKLPVHSKNPLLIPFTAFRVRQVLIKYKVDIVDARSRIPAWITKITLFRLKNVKFITSIHSGYGLKPRWFKKWYNSIMLSGKHVVTVSEYMLNDYILPNYSVDKSKITVINRGADNEKYNPALITEEQKLDFARKNGIKLDKKIVLLPARVSRVKGHELLVEAVSMMKNRDFYCVILGNGSEAYKNELKSKISTFGLDDMFIFIDTSYEMQMFYAVSEVVISLSAKPEAFGRTVVEAQMMENVVIAAKHGAPAYTVVDNSTGFHCKPNDSKDLAIVLNDILFCKSAEDILKIKQEARKIALEKFTTSEMCKKTLEVYTNLHH